jgi:hypothetical protein
VLSLCAVLFVLHVVLCRSSSQQGATGEQKCMNLRRIVGGGDPHYGAQSTP